jgi:hypothetical protein
MKMRIVGLLIAAASVTAAGSDFEYNSGGYLGYQADLFGSSTGWGQWFVTTVQNPFTEPIQIVEFGFPCCGPATGEFGWVVWVVGGVTPPPGSPTTADFHGAFTPGQGSSGDPSVYTYVDVSYCSVIIPAGAWFCFGFQNTAYGGQTPYNGVATWSWDEATWIGDAQYYRTAVLQVKADIADALPGSTWAAIKSWGRT